MYQFEEVFYKNATFGLSKWVLVSEEKFLIFLKAEYFR